MGRFEDITGKRFGKLVVIGRSKFNIRSKPAWDCICDCGNKKSMSGSLLKNGNSTSCGCKTIETATTHGMAGTHTYNVWTRMHNRCSNTKERQYKNYGGRGIKVCHEWKSFEVFYKDMGHQLRGMSLDRINVDGDYCKDNCRWVSMAEQQSNKRNNTYVEHNGEKHTLAQWGRITGIDPKVIRSRIFRSKWTIEKALTTSTLK